MGVTAFCRAKDHNEVEVIEKGVLRMREARPGMMSGSAQVNMIEVTVCQTASRRSLPGAEPRCSLDPAPKFEDYLRKGGVKHGSRN